MTHEPLIILGAPRSGTNMLRDAICALPGLGTWPCDEINAIWRHGNTASPTDELTEVQARPEVIRFIRKRFESIARAERLQRVVEKTCANCLRVSFVAKVFPEARFVLIHRDPVDAVSSASVRWNAPLDLRYTLAKARFVPPTDFPRLAVAFLANRFRRFWTRERSVASWGPRFEGMDELSARCDALEVSAHQWNACVCRSAAALEEMPAVSFDTVSYESFVENPAGELARVLDHLGVAASARSIARAVAPVTAERVGAGSEALSQSRIDRVVAITRAGSEAIRRLVGLRGRDARG